jgi:hypothetical protein
MIKGNLRTQVLSPMVIERRNHKIYFKKVYAFKLFILRRISWLENF